MKVAIVAEILTKMGGAERVVEEIWKLYPDADIFTLLYNEKECGKSFPKEKVKTSSLQKWVDRGIPKQFLVPWMPKAIEQFTFDEYDLVISSNSGFAHGIITNSDVPHVCYVHAPMRYAWDYTHQYVQEKTKGWKRILKPLLQKTLRKLRIWDYTSASRPDILLANSKTTQRRIEKFWRRESTVLYPPVDTHRFTSPSSRGSEGEILYDNDFYFIVSMLEPFKKIDIAVEAFTKMPEKNLIIIGDGSQKPELETLAKNSPNISFLGRQSDEVVTKHMQTCKAFIFPGLEDFGITPVEAMACGKPVIFFNKGGVTETVIDGETGIAFEPQTAQSLKSAINQFEQSTQQLSVEAIQKRSEEFSKERFQENLKNILDSVA